MKNLLIKLEGGGARVGPIDRYDPACERLDTAIKGIWRLWRRGKWSCLAELGLTRREFEDLFEEFDITHITTDHGLIYQEATVEQLIQFEKTKLGTTKIVEAAGMAIALYILAFQDERREHLLEEGQAA